MALQAGGWFSIGLATYTGRPGQASPALGLILAGAATVLLVPAVTALLTKSARRPGDAADLAALLSNRRV
jgi:zinc transporter ZupT